MLSAETLKEKAAEHGWKAFTDKQYDEAVQFIVDPICKTKNWRI